jgi:type I restriction enzyme M protein
MLTDTSIRAKVDALWDKLWSGGLPNPSDVIEQLSYLIFLKRLDEKEEDNERAAKLRGIKFKPIFPKKELRWSYWTQLPAEDALKHVKDTVFPFIKTLGGEGGAFGEHMANAEFKISKPSLLIEACKLLDDMQLSAQNQDVQGDLYEYVLSKLNVAGQNGQFRTPRHIIRMMVKMINPRPGERICDPAAGTCGFLVNAYQHILETHTRPDVLQYDEEGWPHRLVGDKLSKKEHEFVQTEALTGYDSDSGMTMLRIGCMNLILHGIDRPNFRWMDTLSKAYNEERRYDVVLANPPFKGAIDSSDVNPSLPVKCKKTEILFVHLFLRLLENGGHGAVIVPDGVLFGSSTAHVEIRKKLIEENRLDGVVSMPAGVFRPYAGVSTAVLLFTKGGSTGKIWFYDMEHDGFSLDDKRQKVHENDIPDLIECWNRRHDHKFWQARTQRLAKLKDQIAPLKANRLKHHETIHRLKFEEVMAGNGDANKARVAREKAEEELEELQTRISPLENEINQLGRQFWVNKEQIKAKKYDLSASRYRQIEKDEVFYENPAVTLERMMNLEAKAKSDLLILTKMLSNS